MANKIRALSAIEIYAISKELEPLITNGFVKKIYHIKDNVYIVLHRGADFMLVLAPGRLHITNYKEKFPLVPGNFCMFLRKHLDGAVLKSVKQHEFERIAEFHFTRKDKEYFLIAEFFGNGNVIQLNSKREIMGALKYREWKDRSIKRGIAYAYPPATINLLKITDIQITKMLSESKLEIVRALARTFGLGGIYAEEICARACIDKKTPASSLSEKNAGKIYIEIKNVFTELNELNKGFQYLDGETVAELAPIRLKSFSNLQEKEFGSFSEACDEFFIKSRVAEIGESEGKIRKKYEVILGLQKENLHDLLKEIEESKTGADELSIQNQFREAAKLYERIKKNRKKIEGLKKAIEKTEKRLSTLTFEEKVPVKKEKKEKHWFEKFRNFETTGGFLVVCGKDAPTNELLIKKYTAKEDIVFHADIQGAPFCSIKTEGRKVSENDLGEAAVISACYSKAWQRGLGVQDVYWVSPEQLSKKAPAGEFVASGAFMVYGKKNYINKVPLKLFIGVNKENKIIAGAMTYVKERAIFYSVIIPGDEKSKELAEKMRHEWIKKAAKETAEKIRAIDLGEIQKYIPSGKGRLVKE